MDRRNFLKSGALAVGGAALLGGLSACAPASPKKEEGNTLAQSGASLVPEGLDAACYEASLACLEPIEDFSEERTYDIVVVGAGVSGVPAVMTAVEEGASVACLQKENTVSANGSGSMGMFLEASDEQGLANWKNMYRQTTSNRYDPALLDFWVQHSGETVRWMAKWAFELDFPNSVTDRACSFDDGSAVMAASNTFRMNGDFLTLVADKAAAMGAEFFFETPAVQLISDETGRVTGVVGKTASGDYIKFNATKGVVLATGDYENNEAMKARFARDLLPFTHVQVNRTGDGILMAALAGGHVVPGPHPAQLHDMHTTPFAMQDVPFFAVSMEGERFMNEEVPMDAWWMMLRHRTDGPDIGHFCRIFDNDYAAVLESWGQKAPTAEELEPYLVESDKYNGKGGMYCADSLEELAQKMGIPEQSFIASVKRYNELCDSGADPDFGKDPSHLAPIRTAPFWGVVSDVTCCAIDGGIAVDGNYQVIDANRQPIPGLFSVGSGAGCLCGDVNWPLEYTGTLDKYYGQRKFGGMSNGHCMTAGRYATLYALTGGFEPKNPVPWNERVRAFYFEGSQENPWA